MKYELKNYSFGQAIGKGFNLYLDNFFYVVGISLILYLPLFYFDFFAEPIETEGFNKTYFYGLLYYIITGFFLTAIITQIVSKKYLGMNVSTKDYYLINPPRLFPLFLLAIIDILIYIPWLIVVFYYYSKDVSFVIQGLFLLLIPTIILMVGISVSINVFIMENASVIESLKRSWRLTKGRRWPIFGIIVFFNALNWLMTSHITNSIADHYPVAYDMSEYLLTSLVDPIIECIFVVVYYNLRIEKEGFNVEHLADQFTRTEKMSEY